MAYKLEIEKTGSTPYILIDEEKHYMRFEGECFHENVMEFYKEVINWLAKYLQTDFKIFIFDCELRYFNSSTTKLLLNILLKMDSHASDYNMVTVNWITTGDNDIIIECGKDFKEEMHNVAFNIMIK